MLRTLAPIEAGTKRWAAYHASRAAAIERETFDRADDAIAIERMQRAAECTPVVHSKNTALLIVPVDGLVESLSASGTLEALAELDAMMSGVDEALLAQYYPTLYWNCIYHMYGGEDNT